LEKLTKLIAIELSLEQLDSTSPSTFSELGGDSLGAVSFSLAIEDVFDVSIAGDSILSPTGCLRKWAGEIENQLSDDDKRADFTEIHKKNASRLDAKDLSLDRFLGEEWLDQISSCQPLEGNNKTVLLTGANGFLGRAVCMQWLEKLSQIDGKLICIIRARDDNSAKARLEQVFSDATPELKMQYQSLADKHLEVIAGDAGEKYLGVGEKRFSELAQQVDRICHVAALVNHRLAYQHLFGPNVAGTAEIIRLATTFRKKGIDFVSTEGVIPLLDPTAENNEEALPRESVPLADTYAAGYASSKWAGEVLLRNANEQCGIPVNILRGNMMLAHQHYPGQINTADMFTRLLFSVVTTGLAPQSFYPIGMDGTKQQGHYDGLPVNIVAATVIAAADFNNSEQCLAFNINNYHNDGCSLDSFVDWIESAGNDVTRIDDYQAWFDRFRDKLNTLPEKQRQQSALEILGAYEQPDQLSANLRIDCNNFKKIASSLDNGQGIPHLDEAFIHKCLRDMSFLGVL
jgi:fatty acid CoA ligase FadD9